MASRVAAPVALKAPSSNTFFLIHGYTGSPTDFNGLPRFLERTFGARVEVPLLPGHGTRLEDLDRIRLNDLISAAEEKLVALLAEGNRVVLGGHSLGAEIALYLASRHPVSGVFTTAIPYQLKFPFNIPGISLLGYFKKYWPKKLPPEEIERRKAALYYPAMPAYGLSIAHEANRLLRGILGNVTCPLLTIQSRHEHISDEVGQELIHRAVKSAVKETLMLENETHGVFYSGDEHIIYRKIADFVKSHKLFA